ncbi:SDR family NAD(P)-dependent oxidoreductase [uncultured Halomonas sp.]|uniref:SDR family NAD(P)-dependent oxidoreductase n=1 Tax=uncultured Halomonas sp. TaxID=173971 RepID=UPI00261614B9|nr:SDR family oxidoreductase [uncultured Halomonas sp.]
METQDVALLGASGGLGMAIAEALLARGDRVWLLDLGECRERLAALISAWPTRAHFIGMDLTEPASLAAAFAGIRAEAGALDACINAAGVIFRASFEETDADALARVMAVNVTGPFQALQHAVALMPQGGRIVNVASAHGLRTGPERSAYAMSKGAILALTRALAVELGPRGILVNAVAPGPVSAGMQDATSDSRRRWQQATPLRRVARPDEVARAVLQLASPENTFTTGQTLVIDGGATAMVGG